jgi:hypothetical protein
VRRYDPGFREDTQRFSVFLDGAEISADCFTADEELGEAHVFVRDENGEFKIDYALKEIESTILRGRVEIRERADG